MKTIISLGWGVQSFTLAAMSALGELPPVDAAIHADTTHEHQATYEFAREWTPWLEARSVQIVTVRDESGATEIGSGARGVFIPAFTSGDGQLRRQCTQRWKIAPMRHWIQANRSGEIVEQWLGISLDEIQRMKPSDVKYITHRWPLIEKRMTRQDCVAWLMGHGLDVPVKSACVFCPYKNRDAWKHLHDAGGDDWNHAVRVDEAIRKARPPLDLFVHPSRTALAHVDMRTERERGQSDMYNDECTGTCFL